jgi:ABC-type Fe3+/spermidine/putrescine transport system ATPase subunit
MSDQGPAVSLRHVTKRFGAVVAVNNLSIDIGAGQFVSLLGPSGCGKTTVLRIIAGLETVTAGAVHISGHDVTYASPQRRSVGFAFQQYALFPHLSVRENVGFGLRVQGVPARERQARVDELLELVRLPHLADRRPDEISGGQAQRIALARALAPDPGVLLLDEPLSALDLSVRVAMQEELRRLHRELRKTFIYVTHDQGEALTMSDRIVLVSSGEIIQDGPPAELYREPRSLFAARFVGQSNVLPVSVRDSMNGDCTVTLGERTEIRGRGREPLEPGDDGVYVVRPEAITFVDHPRSGVPGCCVLEGRVHDVFVRGSDATVILRLDTGHDVRVAVGVADAERFELGERRRIAWRAQDAMVFRPSPAVQQP